MKAGPLIGCNTCFKLSRKLKKHLLQGPQVNTYYKPQVTTLFCGTIDS
jgi:hypothetical protein